MADDAATGGFAERLGARAEHAEDGRATVRFDATDEHLDPAGTLHGGVLATLVDTAACGPVAGPRRELASGGGRGGPSSTCARAHPVR